MLPAQFYVVLKKRKPPLLFLTRLNFNVNLQLNVRKEVTVSYFVCRISGSRSVDCDEYYRLECNAAHPDKFANVSEESTASIIRLEEFAKQQEPINN
jgi:hypothetical protein